MAEKKKAGPIKYFMNKNEFNAICNLMYIIGEKLKAGRYTTFSPLCIGFLEMPYIEKLSEIIM